MTITHGLKACFANQNLVPNTEKAVSSNNIYYIFVVLLLKTNVFYFMFH